MHNFIEEEPDQNFLMNQACLINFAFCPNSLLVAKEDIMENLASSLKNDDVGNLLTDKDYRAISDATRFFYICYSLKFGGPQDYFYFQTFSKVADSEVVYSNPLYGFYKKEDIIKLVSVIDDYFYPSPHDKQIFDNVTIDSPAPASSIINLMTAWTGTKLLQFSNFYQKDKLAQAAAAKAKMVLDTVVEPKSKQSQIQKKPTNKNKKESAIQSRSKKTKTKNKKAKSSETGNTSKNKPVNKPDSKRKSKKKINDRR